MAESHAVEFDQLADADLVLDRTYRGGNLGGTRDDPLSRLLPVGNQGGFRPAGSTTKDTVKLVVLYTTGAEPDWPDVLDPFTGAFTYYGDNRSPGTKGNGQQKGNLLLRKVVDWAHGDVASRAKVLPFLLFEKPGTGREVRFRGVLGAGIRSGCRGSPPALPPARALCRRATMPAGRR